MCIQENVDEYPIERIHPRYLKADDATVQRATADLYARPAPEPWFRADPQGCLRANEQRTLLTMECTSLGSALPAVHV